MDKAKEIQFDGEKGRIVFLSELSGHSYMIKFGEYARVVEDLERRVQELEEEVARLRKGGE